MIILSLYWRSLNAYGLVAGMVSGAITVVVWAKLSGGIFDLYELLPGFVISLLCAVIFSLLKPSAVKTA